MIGVLAFVLGFVLGALCMAILAGRSMHRLERERDFAVWLNHQDQHVFTSHPEFRPGVH